MVHKYRAMNTVYMLSYCGNILIFKIRVVFKIQSSIVEDVVLKMLITKLEYGLES